jgi:DedD protein
MRSIVEEEEKESTDTEITLGMKSLLGVFFGAVLVCGVFFGFGYSLGRSSAHPAPAAAPPNTAVAVAPSSEQDSASGASQTADQDQSATQAPPAAAAPLKTIVSDQTASATPDKQYEYVPTPDGPARRPIDAPAKPHAAVASTSASTRPSASIASAPAPQDAPPAAAPKAEPATFTETRNAPATSTMVQIAAVTHQEDASILVGALKKRGYEVVVRNDPKDSLLHVQVGPFASRDEARAMRARLLADGYNAILK